MKTYRITITQQDPISHLTEIVEILEVDREKWTTVFDFVHEYEAEINAQEEAEEAEANEHSESHHPGNPCSPRCKAFKS